MQNLILLHSLQGRPPIMDAMGDAVLQQLLQQGLSAYQRDAAQQPVPTPALQLDSALLTSPEFRMYCYKIVPCTRRYGHDWTACPFCHPGEKATRRCPQKSNYLPIACPDMKKAGECPRGESCLFAHNVFEYWLHPLRYRSQMCSFGTECRRGICFFAHAPHELRHADQSYLQEIERQLDAMGVSSAAFGFPPANVARSQQSNSTGAIGSHGHPPRARVPMGTGLNTMGGIVGGAPEEVSSAALLVQMQLQRTTGETRPHSLMQQPQQGPNQAPITQQQPTSSRAGSQHQHGVGGGGGNNSPGGSSASSGAGMSHSAGAANNGSGSLIPGLPGDRAEQERIIQAAALLGMDPLQLAQLKQLATQTRPGGNLPALNVLPATPAANQIAASPRHRNTPTGSAAAQLQATMQQVLSQAATAVSPTATNSNAGFGDMAGLAAAAAAALGLSGDGAGASAQQQAALQQAAAALLTPSASLRSPMPSLPTPLPSLTANEDTMAATLKLLADITLNSSSQRTQQAGSQQALGQGQQGQQQQTSSQSQSQQQHQQQQGGNHGSASAPQPPSAGQSPHATSLPEGGAFSSAAAVAAAALTGGTNSPPHHGMGGQQQQGGGGAGGAGGPAPGSIPLPPLPVNTQGLSAMSATQVLGVLQQVLGQAQASAGSIQAQHAIAALLPQLLKQLEVSAAPPQVQPQQPATAPNALPNLGTTDPLTAAALMAHQLGTFNAAGGAGNGGPVAPGTPLSTGSAGSRTMSPHAPTHPPAPQGGAAGGGGGGGAGNPHYQQHHAAGGHSNGNNANTNHHHQQQQQPHGKASANLSNSNSNSLSPVDVLSMRSIRSGPYGSGTASVAGSDGSCSPPPSQADTNAPSSQAGRPGSAGHHHLGGLNGLHVQTKVHPAAHQQVSLQMNGDGGMAAAAALLQSVASLATAAGSPVVRGDETLPAEPVEMCDLVAHPELRGADHLLSQLSAMISDPSTGGAGGPDAVLPSRHSLATFTGSLLPTGPVGSLALGAMGGGGGLLEQKGSLAIGAFDFNHRAHSLMMQGSVGLLAPSAAHGPFGNADLSHLAALFNSAPSTTVTSTGTVPASVPSVPAPATVASTQPGSPAHAAAVGTPKSAKTESMDGTCTAAVNSSSEAARRMSVDVKLLSAPNATASACVELAPGPPAKGGTIGVPRVTSDPRVASEASKTSSISEAAEVAA